MSEITIKIKLKPFNDVDMVEWSKVRKKSVEVIEKITKELNTVDVESFHFNFEITTK